MSQTTMRPHALRVAVHAGALWSRCMPERGEVSSHAMLATARPSCTKFLVNPNLPLYYERSFSKS